MKRQCWLRLLAVALCATIMGGRAQCLSTGGAAGPSSLGGGIALRKVAIGDIVLDTQPDSLTPLNWTP